MCINPRGEGFTFVGPHGMHCRDVSEVLVRKEDGLPHLSMREFVYPLTKPGFRYLETVGRFLVPHVQSGVYLAEVGAVGAVGDQAKSLNEPVKIKVIGFGRTFRVCHETIAP
ncbi:MULTISPECIES: hypothetical protein [Streptomyces]|uniref:Uncharacterized protein n=1 Tax=Streptomyces ramulosus TaxID=47762 RepID=A0ABW1FL99_9ACTN